MKRFELHRDVDVSGVSGTGVVAEGVAFSDGTAAVRWTTGAHRSTVIWADVESVAAIHGHGGATRLVWIDDLLDEPKAFTSSHDRLVLHRALEAGDDVKGIVLVKCPHLTGLALSIDGPDGEEGWLGLLPCPCNDTSEVIGTLNVDHGCAKCKDSGRCCTDHGKHATPHLGCILR